LFTPGRFVTIQYIHQPPQAQAEDESKDLLSLI